MPASTAVRTYAYYQGIFQDTPKPFAYVDLDYFDENIQAILQRAGDRRIRVASKSVRCVELLKRILSASKQFQGLMAYHPLEAVFLSQQGFDDLLLAYPFWDEAHIRAVALELKRGKRLYPMVDCREHVERFSRLGAEMQVEFPLCLDVDMSMDFLRLHFGVYRSQVDRPSQVAEIAAFIDSQPHVRLVGLMGYEAQLAGVQDHLPGKTLNNLIVPWLKRRSLSETRERRRQSVQAARPERLDFVNGGGTGSVETTGLEAWVTEITVGSGFYSPTLFDGYRQFRHRPAAAFALEIARQPREHIYTCLGGGYIASGSAGAEKLPRPYLPEGCQLLANEGAGEVQTPVEYRGPLQLRLGDPIFFRHAKAGELCERFNQLYLVSEGKISGTAATYRGEGQSFL
ncbi:MAG: amino acid aldolase [Chloroflexi bacterium RBG_16_54_18]|nr:MAG: amino acid aldolase [Chloroflexi bacterium RBG_16_54_18]